MSTERPDLTLSALAFARAVACGDEDQATVVRTQLGDDDAMLAELSQLLVNGFSARGWSTDQVLWAAGGLVLPSEVS